MPFRFHNNFFLTSHDIPDSILFAQYLTESPQPQCQVMPGIYGLYDSTSQATNNPNTFQFSTENAIYVRCSSGCCKF